MSIRPWGSIDPRLLSMLLTFIILYIDAVFLAGGYIVPLRADFLPLSGGFADNRGANCFFFARLSHVQKSLLVLCTSNCGEIDR